MLSYRDVEGLLAERGVAVSYETIRRWCRKFGQNQEAAEAFLQCVIEGNGYRPRVVITDTLASYPPALRRVLPGMEHRRHKGLNSRPDQ